MMKLLCVFFLCAAGTTGGMIVHTRLSTRVRILKKTLHGFEDLRNSIVYLSMPLQQALIHSGEPLCGIELTWDNLNKNTRYLQTAGMSRTDAAEACRYLSAMMTMSPECCTAVCSGAVEAFSRLYRDALEEKKRSGKPAILLGPLAGLALSVLIF